ncbi:hypothetical protein CIK05_14330 [Bdellovibrio sp. qaytius]|nr:hypothetical protein CIK05_14330 [Bdellovibrio sp. qaytius]
MKLIINLVVFTVWGILTVGCASTGQKNAGEASGVVSRFLTTPDGSVDGFLFQDGMQIRFPSHMSTIVTDAVAVGDEVTVKGEESTTNSMWAKHIITSKNANEIDVTSEAKGKMLAPKRERLAAIKNVNNISVRGEIDTLIVEPSGEVSGFLLTEGSLVRLPTDIRRPTKAYDVGQYVEVTGYGSENKFGKSVEASTVQRQSDVYQIDTE